MKRFKELTEELFNEGGEMYPADEMTISELKIACYAASNILERLEDGAMIQRWQISAIVKAKEELASVYTSMSADEMEDDMMDTDSDEYDEEEPMYVGFEYPSMYGEETELDEAPLLGPQGKIHRAASADQSDREYASQKFFKDTWKAKNVGKKWPGYSEAGYKRPTYKNEETDYEVDVEGLQKMYVKGDNPSQIKNNLRKVVKNPDMIRGIERVAKATLQKMFRDKASGKEEVAEEVEQLSENPWNQKFQKAPVGDTLPTPARGTVPKHNIKFKEGDQVIVHAGPHAGERHTVTYARTGSVNLLHPSPKNKYDTTTVRAKHEHLSPYKGPVKEEVAEGYNDPVHRENISDVVHTFVPKDDPKHDKIVDHLHKAKNFGTKTKDDLETVAGISIGAAHRITKAVADHMKANFGAPSKPQTQAQRVGAYLKQKQIGPRSK